MKIASFVQRFVREYLLAVDDQEKEFQLLIRLQTTSVVDGANFSNKSYRNDGHILLPLFSIRPSHSDFLSISHSEDVPVSCLMFRPRRRHASRILCKSKQRTQISLQRNRWYVLQMSIDYSDMIGELFHLDLIHIVTTIENVTKSQFVFEIPPTILSHVSILFKLIRFA